ncbi:hypothetical protein WN51_05226 [Melipona quadrifasciata]|uniref:Uncharacterized protein n=1 Tax=Melipona quadrifasciata TaxID=166423 RepID=A0A0M8ZUI9_9HYME|nr:hypothetical protein WN51_05226 [Melipona quadrifasciata]
MDDSAILEKNTSSSGDTFFLGGALTRLKLGAIIIITSTLFFFKLALYLEGKRFQPCSSDLKILTITCLILFRTFVCKNPKIVQIGGSKKLNDQNNQMYQKLVEQQVASTILKLRKMSPIHCSVVAQSQNVCSNLPRQYRNKNPNPSSGYFEVNFTIQNTQKTDFGFDLEKNYLDLCRNDSSVAGRLSHCDICTCHCLVLSELRFALCPAVIGFAIVYSYVETVQVIIIINAFHRFPTHNIFLMAVESHCADGASEKSTIHCEDEISQVPSSSTAYSVLRAILNVA